MSAPAITGLSAFAMTEGDASYAINPGLSISGGSTFGGGFIRFGLDGNTTGDQWTLNNAADGNLNGAISVDAGVVYLGNGAGRDAIGAVDTVENGQNGAALKINLGVSTDAVANPSFENGAANWTIGASRVILGTDQINGWATPSDPTVPPAAGDDAGGVQNMTYNSEFAANEHTAGANSLRLYNSGTTLSGFEVVHGPYAFSDTFAAAAGDVFRFDWKAAAGGDAYDAFGYLLNVDTGATLTLLNETGADAAGQKPWTTEAVVVPDTGNWSFVFVAGTYDFTGGQGVGGSLYVDNIRTMTSNIDGGVLQAIASQVSYQNTSQNPADGGRTFSLEVEDGLGASSSDSAAVTITAVNDAPTGGVAIDGAARPGETLTASNTIVDLDGFDPLTLTYQWQRGQGGVWADLVGADLDTYDLTEADRGYAIRVVAEYTDDGGTAESVASAATSVVRLPSTPPSPPVFDEQGNLNLGTTGADTMSGLAGDDEIRGGFASDFLHGNQGADMLTGNQGDDTLHGGQDNDIVRGGQDEDLVFGALGDDQLFGDMGGDLVDGGEGNDILWGGQGLLSSESDRADTLAGGAGDDYANGNAGDDAIDGGVGRDTLHGGKGDDVVFGGDGDDIVFGNTGSDTLSGGAGADAFHFHGGGRDVVVDFDFAEGDRIFLDSNLPYTAAQQGADTVITWSDGQVLLTDVQLSTLSGGWIIA
ncbi:MAG TPA: hypothetical protein VM471_03855 [Phenylobacterium sp.]|nr:hypothetical protein [Phenylobacterium sp.]